MTMIEQLQKILKTPFKNVSGYEYKTQAKSIHTVNGPSISVQASKNHYCTPRDNFGPYVNVEVGYPLDIDKMPDSWKYYAEAGEEVDVSNIYAYIPIELVAEFIEANGGIKE